MFKKEKNNDYLTIKESREIIKYNIRQMKYYEAQKRIKRSESEYTAPMHDENNVVEIDDLHTSFFTDRGTVKSVDGGSFSIPKNKIVGVVGESGCGKSVTSLSIMQLVAAPQGQITGGSIRFNSDKLGYNEEGKKLGFDVTKMPTAEMHKIRGQDITMIFQEPMTSLNPVFTIGYQLDEVSFLHKPKLSKEDVKAYSIEMLKKVGISMPERFYAAYPHELSGGMRQRVMIAMALAGNPKLIIADEPTTALDVTIQAQVLELMKKLKQEYQTSLILITHDLGVVAKICDKVAVVYAGEIVESGTLKEIYTDKRHPYTIGLFDSLPDIENDASTLKVIQGVVPDPANLPDGCKFHPRCPYATEACQTGKIKPVKLSDSHMVRCNRFSDTEV